MSLSLRYVTLISAALGVGCSSGTFRDPTLRHFPMDDLTGIVAQSGVTFDAATSSDGKGSVKIVAREPVTVRLYDVDSIDIDEARLVYRARVRTENVTGQVFLEMWCRFPGKGEFFSRGLDHALAGTVGWTTLEAPFILQAGQTPDLVQLNIVVDGSGTVWVDDINLVREDL
jgi:hypothetical protein